MRVKKILVVDDSPTDRYLLTDILRRNGFDVETADNGEDALGKIKRNKPQLVLMDVVMPGKSGFQMTRQITRDPMLQDIPIMMCSIKDQESDRIWAMSQGASDYIVKPVNALELLSKIAAIG
jgi:twitching motility two-component system response regulator PilH